MRGQQFGFLGILSLAWVSTRVIVLSLQAQPPVPTFPRFVGLPPKVQTEILPGLSDAFQHPALRHICCAPTGRGVAVTRPVATLSVQGQMLLHQGKDTPSIAGATPKAPAIASPAPVLWTPPSQASGAFQLYAYSYLRAGGAGLTGGRQNGGGQSGFVATRRLGADNVHLMLRGAIAHSNSSERELAAGLRLFADQARSVSLSLERRFRNDAPDAFAAYIAAGRSDIAMPLAFRLDAYAQAGVVAGRTTTAFFDLTMRARRALPMAETVKVGGGLWAGGQDDAARFDIGPTISTEIMLGAQPLRIDADWRFRIAGEARPASGPALTLSTAF
jgi:hypothetical protein